MAQGPAVVELGLLQSAKGTAIRWFRLMPWQMPNVLKRMCHMYNAPLSEG